MTYQLGALDGIARAAGHRMTHMSFHGALGNMVAADAELAKPMVAAVAAFDPKLIIVTSTSRAVEAAAAAAKLPVVITFLADRAYDDAGLLVSRKEPGAVLYDHKVVLDRVRLLLAEGVVITHTGKRLPTRAQSILLHGDNPGAVALARAIRGAVEATGTRIVAASRLAR